MDFPSKDLFDSFGHPLGALQTSLNFVQFQEVARSLGARISCGGCVARWNSVGGRAHPKDSLSRVPLQRRGGFRLTQSGCRRKGVTPP